MCRPGKERFLINSKPRGEGYQSMREGPTKCQGSGEKPEIYQIGGKGGNRFMKEVELETDAPKCIGF